MEKYVKPQLFAQEVVDPKQGNTNGGNPVKRYSVWEDEE